MSAENNVYLNATLRTEKNFATPLLWDKDRTILILFILEITGGTGIKIASHQNIWS